MSRDISVSKVTGCGMEDRDLILGSVSNISLRHRVHSGSGPTKPPIECALWPLFPLIKQPERKTDAHLHLVSS